MGKTIEDLNKKYGIKGNVTPVKNKKTGKDKLIEDLNKKYGIKPAKNNGKQSTSASQKSSSSNSGSKKNTKQSVEDYSSAVEYLKNKGVQGASGIMTKREWQRRNKGVGTYQDYLNSMIAKYESTSRTSSGSAPASSKSSSTTKKYTDFNTDTKNAYTTFKDKATTKTTISSSMSEDERKKRIAEIEAEMKQLNTNLYGIGRASAYGNSKVLKGMKEETQSRIAELSKELKSLERVGTFSASELKQFEIDDAKAKKSALPTYNPTARVTLAGADAMKKNVSEHYALDKEIETLEREKKLYDDIAKFGDVVNEDNFGGQWRANYRSTELSREADKAISEYIKNPTEENKQIAYAYDAFSKEYMKNNEKALDDENVKASWLSKSMAGYLPQLKDQIVPELVGGGIGLLLGSAVGTPTAGGAIGAGLGTYSQMYDVMRGSVYRTLLAEGVDEETALQAAEDEALISSLIEGGETAVGWLLAGGGKAIGAVSNAAKASVAKGSTNAATKFVASLAGKATNRAASNAAKAVTRPLWNKGLRVAGGIVGNALTEYGEEAIQQGVSIANKERAMQGETGKWDLTTKTGEVIADAVTGKRPEALAEMHEAGTEGFKIGLMFGGAQTTANNIVSQYANAKTVKLQNEIADTIANDEEALNVLIEEGKASGAGTVSEKIATEIETARENGKGVTREQVKKLIASNETYSKAEEQAAAPATLEQAAREVVTERNKKSGTPLAQRLEAQSQNNEPIAVADVKKATGFGDNGAKLVTEIASKDGMTFEKAIEETKVAYLSGYNGEGITFTNDLHIRANLAGIDDRIIDNNIAKENAKNATVYKGTFTENKYTKNWSEATKKMVSTVAKHFGMDIKTVDKIIANKFTGAEANALHQDGKMRISRTAEKLIHALVLHESGHRMEQFATAEWNELANFLYNRAEKLGRRAELGLNQGMAFDAVKAEHDNAGISMSTSGYINEIAVRELETIFSSPEEFNSFIAEIETNQKAKSAWGKFVEWLSKLIEDLKTAWSQRKMTAAEKAEAKKALAEMERIKELYAKAYLATKDAVAERANAQDENAQNADAKGDANFSLKGTRADGIEVYETSKEVMNMPVKDRKKLYLRLMNKEYTGRTARFVRNGHTYYAEFDKTNLSKAMYGDDRSSESGLKALTRVGADGDIFDLVENSTYDHSSPDTKNHSRTDYFDYFIKTVQIDNKVYDLLADVKKQYGKDGGYVYTLVLTDNKKIEVAPTEASQIDALKGVETTSENMLSQKPNSVKSNFENVNPTSDPDINFSLKEPVEETKNLIALHNMQSSELERTLDLGGLPMPSIAIIKAQSGHSEYGDVSLVFDKSVIDPKANKNNKVYGGDAWTPTYPKIEYKPNDKIAKKISDKYYDFSSKFGYDESKPLYSYVYDLEEQLNRNKGEAGMLNELYEDTRVMQLYLLDSGKNKVDTINKETRTELSESEVEMNEYFINSLGADVVDEVMWDGNGTPLSYRKNYLSKYDGAIRETYKNLLSEVYKFSDEQVQNVLDSTKAFDYLKFVRDAYNYRQNGRVTIKTEADYEATQKAIKEAAGEDYRKWVDSLFKGVEEKSGIRNNVDYFTNNGNRRSWEALHWENNLENVIKVMKSQADVGSVGFFSGQNIWGVAAKNYGSIEEIKADSDRLQRLPEEEYNKIKEGFGQRLSEIAHSIMDKSERNPFIASDNAMECIVDAVRNSKTKSGILNSLRQYQQLTVTETTVDDIVALVNDISNMPTEYFEAKPKRAVELNEIATAIIPDNISQATKTRLDDMGIKYVEYEAGNEQARLEALNSLEDVQFSLKGSNNINAKDTKELLDIIEHLKGEFEVTKFAKADPKKLTKMTKDLLKEYSSQADFDETYKAIDELYQYMANGEDGQPAVWEDVYNKAFKVAREIVRNAVVVDDYMYQEYKSLRDYLRNTPMKFYAGHDSVPVAYENFNDFRKMNMGRLKFTKDGVAIDAVYQELSSLYPEFFDSERENNTADQLEQIINVLDEIQPTEVNPFDRQIEQASMHLANDITSRFFDIPQAKPTFADKAERRVVEAHIKGGKRVEAVRQQKDAKIKKLIEAQKERTKKQLDKIREQRDTKVKKEQEKRRAAVSKMSETQKAKVLRAQIMRHASDLSKKLVSPTDNQHIPHELQGAVAKLLECINLESNYTYDTESHSYKKNDEGLPTRRTQAFNELKKVYADIASSVVVDPDLIGEHGLLSGVISLADKRIADMTSSELETVWQTIRAIEASVSTANRVFSEGKFTTILEIAEALRTANKEKISKTEFKGLIGKSVKLATLDMLTPETYLHCLGEAGDSVFRMMRDAQDKHIRIMKEVADFTHKSLKDVDVNSLEKTLHTVKLGGEKVQLSTAQLMELYVLMKREQAAEHILVGGILPDVTEGKGLKLNAKTKPIRNISVDEISAAISKLTDEQKKVADQLQKYVSTVLSAYGNEASMQVYNYEKFNEKNYWTIRTNRQEIQSDIDKDTAVTSVANKGMTKATKPHANTSVRIGSIFDTFASHSSDMATYAAWLGTSEDVNRIRNFVFWEDGARKGTVKDILDTVHGTQGSKYLEKLLTDVAIGVKGTDNLNPFDRLVGHYKAASVGANLRVVIQQPTAILRAMDMIDAHYLAEGAVRPLKGWKKAMEYAPIAQWKDWGYFDINTGRQMKDVLFDNASLLEKTKQVGMWGASKADSISWGLLWNAVEAETKANHKDLEVGSDAYYKTVAKRFTEVVDHTQVVDGILQRSQLMRSPDALTKMATSFMGEPTKQYNMAVAAAYDAKNLKGDAKKKAVARLGRTAASLAVAGIINACAQSFIDAMRDDDKEKDYWERWLAAFAGDGEEAKWYDTNLADTANPLNYIPFAKDVVSIWRGYDVKRMDTEAITKVLDASKNMYKATTGTGKYTITEASAQLFAEIARMYGVPVANVKRDIKSIVMTVATETDNYLMQYRMEKAMLNINYAGNSKNFMDILFNAYNNDEEAYKTIYNDMLDSGYDADKIKSGMETRMMKAEGVKKTSELSKRYMTPAVEKKYDSSLSQIKSSGVWKSANSTQRKEAEADLYNFLTSDSKTMEETRAEAKAAGVDETEYALYQLAIEMADQPKGEKGSGNYDYKEKAEAINSLNLGDEEIAYFFGKGLNEYGKQELNQVLSDGIDVQDYVNFKAATSDMKADKDAKGKSIPNSKKKKIVKYLNSAGLTDEEWNYFYYEIMDYKT